MHLSLEARPQPDPRHYSEIRFHPQRYAKISNPSKRRARPGVRRRSAARASMDRRKRVVVMHQAMGGYAVVSNAYLPVTAFCLANAFDFT